MSVRKVPLLFFGLTFLAIVASAEPLRLKLGSAETTGVVTFVLWTPANDTLSVEAAIDEGTPASVKAALIKAAVQSANPTWIARANGNTLIFRHWVAAAKAWVDVDYISHFKDTSGGGGRIEGRVAAFRFQFQGGTSASGSDLKGRTAVMSATLTGSLTWTRPIVSGETPGAILDDLEAFVRENAGKQKGVRVLRESALSLVIVAALRDSFPNYINWEITDTSLLPTFSGEGAGNAGFIRR